MPPGAFGSAGGLYSASCVTFIGSLTSIAWKPPECQVLNAMFWVSVGLCAEYEVRGTSWSVSTVQAAGSFSGSRKSSRTTGRVGSAMSMNRVQPHGQP